MQGDADPDADARERRRRCREAFDERFVAHGHGLAWIEGVPCLVVPDGVLVGRTKRIPMGREWVLWRDAWAEGFRCGSANAAGATTTT